MMHGNVNNPCATVVFIMFSSVYLGQQNLFTSLSSLSIESQNFIEIFDITNRISEIRLPCLLCTLFLVCCLKFLRKYVAKLIWQTRALLWHVFVHMLFWQRCIIALLLLLLSDACCMMQVGDDNYEVVPGSQFVVSRTAFKDNTSSYKVTDCPWHSWELLW